MIGNCDWPDILCCLAWPREVAALAGAGHVAGDGKTLCGSAGSALGPLHGP